ncbi:glycyl-tRNA synthetase 1 [Xylaria sp. FL1042]|nr:glycyl-tRNA synthetase 1 [Xylaria sp. FL1042]
MAPMTTLKRDRFDRSLFESGDNWGCYDYGLSGCALQANIVNLWWKHFVLEENMLELDCTVITPEPALKTSGHVDKFADWMCKGAVKGEYLQADHLVENVLENSPKLDEATAAQYRNILAKIDYYNGPELGDLITKFDIRNPDGNGEILSPMPFNLMLKSTVGPSAASPVYLRPETAQGQFLNFRKLLDFNQGAMPFASASINKSYRNEIWPHSSSRTPDGRDRARTFCRVKSRTIDNETLGYFLGRIMLFLLRIGVDLSKLRFRQHFDNVNEMAHYAYDCWDAELLTSYGWIECVGCADRSAYDLTVHSKFTGTPLVVREALRAGPTKVVCWQQDAKTLQLVMEALNQPQLDTTTPLADGTSSVVELSRDLLTIQKVTRLQTTGEYTPNVIQPSFGIGRLLYCPLEQTYWHRPQDALSLPFTVAPTTVLIVPITRKLSSRLRALSIANNVGSSGASIGKRYARIDELDTPLGITVDFDTVANGSITLRERDTMSQVRGSEDEVVQAIKNLVDGTESWHQITQRLARFSAHGQDDNEKGG